MYKNNIIEDTDDLSSFLLQTLIIILFSLPSVFIDIIFQKYRDKYTSNMTIRNILNMIQIIINIVYVYLIMIFNKNLSLHFQQTLPGMFFAGIFFSLQNNMFTDIHDNLKKLL